MSLIPAPALIPVIPHGGGPATRLGQLMLGLVPPREALATLVVRAELPAAPVAIRARALLDIPADLEIEPLVALPLAEPNRAALQVELNRAALPQAVPSRAALPQAVPNLLPRVKRNPPDSPSLDFLAVAHPATP